MSQHDLNIANQTAPNTRSDINNALQALGSNNSGSSAPSTTYANMHWYDTSSNILKQRSEANDAWISIGYFDQSTNSFKILDDTMVVNTSGTQTGLIGDQATSVWQAGTGTTERLISPAKVKASVLANSVSLTTGSGTATIGTLKMAWAKTTLPSVPTSVFITLPFSYTSTSSFGVVAISDDGNHSGATRGAQGVSITAANQIKYSKAGFAGNACHWFTIGY